MFDANQRYRGRVQALNDALAIAAAKDAGVVAPVVEKVLTEQEKRQQQCDYENELWEAMQWR